MVYKASKVTQEAKKKSKPYAYCLFFEDIKTPSAENMQEIMPRMLLILNHQTHLELVVQKSLVLAAEIRWRLQVVAKGQSNNSSNNTTHLFRTVFLLVTFSQRFSVVVDKLSFWFTYGIAPYFRDIGKTGVGNSDCYVVQVDESLNNASTCRAAVERPQLSYWHWNLLTQCKDFLKHALRSLHERKTTFLKLSCKVYMAVKPGLRTASQFQDPMYIH